MIFTWGFYIINYHCKISPQNRFKNITSQNHSFALLNFNQKTPIAVARIRRYTYLCWMNASIPKITLRIVQTNPAPTQAFGAELPFAIPPINWMINKQKIIIGKNNPSVS